MTVRCEPLKCSTYRPTVCVPHTYLEHGAKCHGQAPPDVDAAFGNGVQQLVRNFAPLAGTSTASVPRTGTACSGSATTFTVTGQEAVLELIELAVLLVDLVQRALVELFLTTGIDLMGQFSDLLSDETIKSLGERSGLWTAPPKIHIRRF